MLSRLSSRQSASRNQAISQQVSSLHQVTSSESAKLDFRRKRHPHPMMEPDMHTTDGVEDIDKMEVDNLERPQSLLLDDSITLGNTLAKFERRKHNSYSEKEAIEDSYNTPVLMGSAKSGNADEDSELEYSDDEMDVDEPSAKFYEREKHKEELYLIPPAVSTKKSSYIRVVNGVDPYDVDSRDLHELRMKFENFKGRRFMNVRYYDVLALTSENVEYLPESKKQAFIDWLKTLEQKWRDANKPREAKKHRKPHPRSPEDYLKLFHSLQPVERKKPLMRMLDQADKSRAADTSKPSKPRQRFTHTNPRAAVNASREFLKTPGRLTPPPTPKKPCIPRPNDGKEEVLSKEEEQEHPWMPTPELIASTKNRRGLLLRAWDQMSECKIDDNTVGFLSGSPSFPLGSAADRYEALRCHANWGNRVKTPFISTTTSIGEIEHVRIPAFTKRQREKGIKYNSKLTIINAYARLAKGLPILSMDAELDYYNVQTPYGDRRNYKNSFYTHEYLFPFRVSIDEIVATWCWQDIEKTIRKSRITVEKWFNTVAVPLYEEHEAARKEGRPMNFKGGCACCGH